MPTDLRETPARGVDLRTPADLSKHFRNACRSGARPPSAA
jgi:hypothetical protein